MICSYFFFKLKKQNFLVCKIDPDIKKFETIRNCLLFPKSRFSINEMIDKHKYEKEAVTEAFHYLNSREMGTIEKQTINGKISLKGNVTHGESEIFFKRNHNTI